MSSGPNGALARRPSVWFGHGRPPTIDDQAILRLVDLIYEAALDAGLWPIFLDRLADALGDGSKAALFLFSGDRPKVELVESARIDPSSMQPYSDYYAARDIWFQKAKLLPANMVITNSALLPNREFVNSEFYNDFLRHYEIFDLCLSVLLNDQGTTSFLSIYRPPNRNEFGDVEQRLLRTLSPHVQRAIRMHLKTGALARQNSAQREALDRMPFSVIFVSADGTVRQTNHAGENMLREKDGLSVRRGRLAAARAQETMELRQLIAEAANVTRGAITEPGGMMALSRPSMRRPLTVLVSPYRQGQDQLALGPFSCGACIFVSDPESRPELPGKAAARLYGLTPAEARLGLGLASGMRLRDLAEQYGITRETARSQLKRVYAKTDTHGQAELVRLLLKGPLGLIADS